MFFQLPMIHLQRKFILSFDKASFNFHRYGGYINLNYLSLIISLGPKLDNNSYSKAINIALSSASFKYKDS